jgi:hypothetical protein
MPEQRLVYWEEICEPFRVALARTRLWMRLRICTAFVYLLMHSRHPMKRAFG